MRCPDCGTDNRAGLKFCVECGAELVALRRPAFTAPYEPGQRFCGECGAPAVFRELRSPFRPAATLLEEGEWLVTQERASEADLLLAEGEIFKRLEVRPWLERLERASGTRRQADALR